MLDVEEKTKYRRVWDAALQFWDAVPYEPSEYHLVYGVGSEFELWRAAGKNESNFNYERFDGFQSDGSECWILERSDKQGVWLDVTEDMARSMIKLASQTKAWRRAEQTD